MNYYPFHLGDYIRATAHLTVEEDCAFRRLIDLYYDTEQPIPNETQMLSRRLRMQNHEKTIGEVLREFFTLEEDGLWHNSRCDEVIAAYQAKCERNRKAGKQGGRPKKKQVETQTLSKRNPNQEPITNNQSKPSKPIDSDNGFDEFWQQWPKKVDKKDAETAWKNLSKTKREAALIDSRTRYIGTEKQFIPSPAKYLRKEKWTDERFEQSEKTKTEREWVAYGQQQGIEPKRGETNSDYAARVKKITEAA